jgi:rod shape determining protein RodA
LLRKFKQMDWAIVIILVLLMVMSTLLIHSATKTDSGMSHLDVKNLIFYALGFLVFAGAAFVDYRFLLKTALIYYIIGIILLIAVLFTEPINGARSWFELPGFNIQPAELVKLILIIFIAFLLSKKEGIQLAFIKDIIPIGISVFIPFVLVLIQPDLGNAIIYLVILLGMLWIGNIRYSYVLIGLAVFIGCMFIFLQLYSTYHDQIEGFLKEKGNSHWMERIDTYLDPENASDDAIYQLRRSKIAIGSGALLGEGYLKGQFIHNNSIPYAYSDSIFVVIGEEFGFMGASILLVLYFLLIYRMILISIQCLDLNGSFIIIGIVSMFVFQIFENIGMLLGIMPLTGITLPFISYGGSSLLINMMALGIVMSIRMHQEKPAGY